MQLLQSATLKLTAWYLLIIMLLSLGFSLVLYSLSSAELERQLPLRGSRIEALFPDAESFIAFRQNQIDAGRARLASNLIVINLVTLAAGGAASYLLARRTLQPIADAMEAQGRFISDASHELRTPLTAMQAEIEVSLRGSSTLSKTAMKSLLESNLQEVNKLRNLSDRLLQLSAENQLQLSPVNLEEPAIDAMNRMLVTAQAKHIAIENEVRPLKVTANAESLSDLLIILLDNAIKYSPEGSTVRLTSDVKGRTALLRIADMGIGINASDLPHIFDRFYRADVSRTSLKGINGYGLGLAIARRIVAMHKGSIDVQSTPGKGTIFTIKLPLAAADDS